MKYTSKKFDGIVQEIKADFDSLNHEAQFYELAIILPTINMYINGVHGALFAPNLFSAIMSARMIFESMGALAYFEKNDPNNKYFNSFLHEMRIRQTDNNGVENDVSIREQLGCIDGITNYKNAKKLYDDMCKTMHFGSAQIMSILRKPKLEKGDQIRLGWIIGPKLLSRKDRVLIRQIVFMSHKIMREIIQYSAKNNSAKTNRFNYKPTGKEKLIPKEYQKIFNEALGL